MATHSGEETGHTVRTDRRIDASIDLRGLLATIMRGRWIVLATMLSFIVLAFVGLSLVSPRYTATSRILVDPRQQRTVQNEVVQQGLGGDMALVDSQMEVIRSESVLRRVVNDADLANNPEFGGSAEGGRSPADTALEKLARATTVARPTNTYVLEITVTTREATLSARLANAIAAAYVADQTSSTVDATRDVSSALHGQLKELQQQLRESEEKVETFKREHNISQTEGRLLGERSLTDLSNRQSQAQARVNETRTRLLVMQEAMNDRGSADIAASTPDSTINALRIRLAEAKQRLAEQQQVLGPRHPRIVSLKQEVVQAEQAIRAENERLVRAAQSDLEAANAALTKVTADLKQATSASFTTNEDLIKLRQLEREAQSVKVVYESYLVRAKETAQQESITARTARVIGEAAVPDGPSFPPRMPLLAAAVVLGLFFGIILAILRDLVTDMLGRTPTDDDPEKKAVPEPGGLLLVTTLGDSEAARRTALDLAQNAVARGRSVLFLDLAPDVEETSPGLAEIALGKSSAYDAVRISRERGVQILGAGRPVAVSKVSRSTFSAMLEVICAEYEDIIANVGNLDIEHPLPALVAAEMSRRAMLVVSGDKATRQEERVLKALSHNGSVAVSAVSANNNTDLKNVA